MPTPHPAPLHPPLLRDITAAGAAGLSGVLRDPGRAVLALDFDGTLADIVADPARSRLRAEAGRTLVQLADRVGHIVVVTGRPVRELAGPQGFLDAPLRRRLHVLGLYGAERWDPAAGRVHAPGPSAAMIRARSELPLLLGELGADPGVLVEDKGAAVAVHTRRAADPHAAFDALRAPLLRLAGRHGLRAEPGRLVIELRAEGGDKGTALSAFLAERDAGAVLCAGDDLGDVPAFDAVARRRARSLPAVLVYSMPPVPGEVVPELARRADVAVPGPAGVVALLRLLAGALRDPARQGRTADQALSASS